MYGVKLVSHLLGSDGVSPRLPTMVGTSCSRTFGDRRVGKLAGSPPAIAHGLSGQRILAASPFRGLLSRLGISFLVLTTAYCLAPPL